MKIVAAKRINGKVTVPGDKSISHRIALIGSIAEGRTRVEGFSTSVDCHSTIECMREMGIKIEESETELIIEGQGLNGLKAPQKILDAGNSGSTVRMLSGILAGQKFSSEITGDDSLCRRPMKRICTPLRQMGASINAHNEDFLPLRISGGELIPIDYNMPVASAQVKSCVLLAGLFTDGETGVTEPHPTRDHTEIMLREFGAELKVEENHISIKGRPVLKARDYKVPGDISSAAFLLAAGLLLPDSEVVIESVGINPTRKAILDLLLKLGANIEVTNERKLHGEPIADLKVRSSKLKGDPDDRRLHGAIIANLIDEIPVLSVIATQVEGGLEIRDASELRVKESDRIRTVVDNLRAMGAEVTEFPDGLSVAGPQKLKAAEIDAAGDHRIAMAFSIAGLIAEGETIINGSEAVDISFPGFFSTLQRLVE